ncbi:hypothetical protein RI367_001433 [Sorochytrium milnesiophthora]
MSSITNYTLQTQVNPAVFDKLNSSNYYPWEGYRIQYDDIAQRIHLLHMPSKIHEGVIKFFEKLIHQQLALHGLIDMDNYEIHTNLDYRWHLPDGSGGMMTPDLSVHPTAEVEHTNSGPVGADPVVKDVDADLEGTDPEGADADLENVDADPDLSPPVLELLGPTCVLDTAFAESHGHAFDKVNKWFHVAPMVELFHRKGAEARLARRVDMTDSTLAPPISLTLADIFGQHTPANLGDALIEINLNAVRQYLHSRQCWWE